jgi:hypothetical protein
MWFCPDFLVTFRKILFVSSGIANTFHWPVIWSSIIPTISTSSSSKWLSPFILYAFWNYEAALYIYIFVVNTVALTLLSFIPVLFASFNSLHSLNDFHARYDSPPGRAILIWHHQILNTSPFSNLLFIELSAQHFILSLNLPLTFNTDPGLSSYLQLTNAYHEGVTDNLLASFNAAMHVPLTLIPVHPQLSYIHVMTD